MRCFGGTYRETDPADTWARVQPRLAEYGITRVADVTDLDVLGIPVFVATRPSAMTVTCSQGKGVSKLLARVSAVMENLETAVGEAYLPPGMPRASFADVNPGYGLSSLSLGWPSALSSATKLRWCTARGMLDRSEVLVPHAVVSLHQDSREPWHPTLFARASNGLASGNTLAEAALHGLWELVERECVMRFSSTPVASRTYIDPHSVTDSTCAALVDTMSSAGFRLEIVDASSGSWPVFAVYLHNGDMTDVFGGAGAHADPSVALARALTEAAQSRLSVISGLRDDIPPDTYRTQRIFVRSEFADAARLRPWGAMLGIRPAVDLSLGAEAQLSRLAEGIAQATGHQPLLCDLSPSHGDFHVCRVISPGLRHDSLGKFARPREHSPAGVL